MIRFAFCVALIMTITFVGGSASAAVDRSGHWMDLGRQEMGAKNFNSAVTYFQRAIVANPKLPIGYVNLAKAEVARARPDLAAKYFAIALELDPIHRDALFGDGMLAISQKANDRAMARLQRLEIACVGCPETEKLKAAIPAP